MKKFLVFFLLMMFFTPSFAEVLKARAINCISTKEPPKTLTVRVVAKMNLKDGTKLYNGYVLIGKIQDIVPPQKLGKDATFSYKVDGFVDSQNIYHEISDNLVLKYLQVDTSQNNSVSSAKKQKCKKHARFELGNDIEIEPNELIFFSY